MWFTASCLKQICKTRHYFTVLWVELCRWKSYVEILALSHSRLVTQSRSTLCNRMDCSTPGSPVLQYLWELEQSSLRMWLYLGIQLLLFYFAKWRYTWVGWVLNPKWLTSYKQREIEIQTQKEDSHVMTEAEIGVMLSKEYAGLPEAGRGEEGSFPKLSRGLMALSTLILNFLFSEL